MNDERKRILRMLAEGTISVDECEELLESLKGREALAESTAELEATAPGPRPRWPYFLLAAVLLIGLFTSGLVMFARTRVGLIWPITWPLVAFGGGMVGTLVFLGWGWMLIDCISRPFRDFRLLFTRNTEYEKWIWIGIIFLAGWLGALVYFVVIRQPAQAIHVRRPLVPPPGEVPYVPSPRARSLKGWLFLVIVILLLIWLVPALLSYLPSRGLSGWLGEPWRIRWHRHAVMHGWPVMSVFASLLLVGIVSVVFWLWMLVDCIARDYREFGTLITSDQTVDKLLWVILIVFTLIIGAIAYHISVRRRVRAPQAASA